VGDLLLIDAGCEVGLLRLGRDPHFSGRHAFQSAQRALYAVVLERSGAESNR